MVKFEQQLRHEVDERHTSGWSSGYINYSDLKKELKVLKRGYEELNASHRRRFSILPAPSSVSM